MWRPDVPREHPQNPPLRSDAQKKAIQEMGTKIGDGDTLICLSCHKVHHGLSGRYLLADTLKNSQLCLRCHPERAEMMNTSHDLRASSPECKNRRGQTPDESGPCGACHSFHMFGRMPDPMPKDPTGMCASCHQNDQCASRQAVAGATHPYKAKVSRLPVDPSLHTFPTPNDSSTRTIACLTCHDPHDVSHKDFLRQPSPRLCSKCHADTVAKLAGSHDLSNRTDIKNGKGQTPAEAGKCGFCHAMHDANGPKLWIGTATAPADADGTCTACHRAGGPATKKPQTKYHHPTGPKTAEETAKLDTNLPLFHKLGENNGAGYVSCGSCHDPHADGKLTQSLLRAGPPTSNLCTSCHKQPAALAGGLHDEHVRPAKWPEPSRKRNDLCLSCHQPHGNDPARGLWTVQPRARYAIDDAACLGCHQHIEWDGHGTQPAQPTASQPALQSVATAGQVHGLPLVPTGPGKTSGSVGCKTCHDTHGQPGGQPHLLRAGHALDPGAMCLSCHSELQYIGLSLHGREQMKGYANEMGRPTRMLQCGPCHSVHAMSSASGQPATGPLSSAHGDMRRCTGCHSTEGGARPAFMPEHLRSLRNVQEPGTPGFLPLVNDAGEIGRAGHIACITCHMPHGRPPGPEFPAIDPRKITTEQVRAMMPMVAPYKAPNLCGSCHGFDGMLRFLYWHEPAKRDGIRD
jgi:predicted CXXCH cytochrome family protein